MNNRPRGPSPDLPKRVKPQLCKLVDVPPQGPEWLHEIKHDGYRMHARLDRGKALRDLLSNAGAPLQYSDHQIGRGSEFYAKACELSLEGIISKRPMRPIRPAMGGCG